MATAVAIRVLGGVAAASRIPPSRPCPAAAPYGSMHVPPSLQQLPSSASSFADPLILFRRNEVKSPLIPSCVLPPSSSSSSAAATAPSCPSYATTPPRRSYYPSVVPSSLYSSFLSSSWSLCSSFVGSRDGKLEWAARSSRRRVRSRGMVTFRSMAAGTQEGDMEEMIKSKNSENAVVVYSRTWCPYCGQVKELFTDLGVSFKAIELDLLVDEQDVLDALIRLTEQRTVPSVFIGGKHIGGCDDTMDLHFRGDLIPALEAAGAKVTSP